jgi:UDP:flavonoid glycosyltransferase YjiC (YdhE family)
MHAILANVGTGGDVFPYIGLGARLRARGHRVTLAANEPFRAAAEQQGLEFHALVSAAATEEFLSHPDIWHPIRSVPFIARWGSRLIPHQYAVLAELARDPDAVLIASPAVFVARVVQEKLGRPLAGVILQPWLLQSVYLPPIVPGFSLPRWAPHAVGHLYWRLVDVAGDLLIGKPLNRLRAKLGMRPVRQIFRWWLAPDLVLGLFPAWFGPPQPDWPPQVRLTNFPMFDGQPAGGLAEEVRAFCTAGDPPIAFTFGTGMMHGASLFRAAVEACQRLGTRGLFLTKYTHQLPPLPPTIRHCAFAPFQELFPLCAAVVHHGGIGTTAKALAAGAPQLVLPHAYDQVDNATRAQRLGTGTWLRARHFTGPRLTAALAEVLTPTVRARCQSLAAQFGNDGLEEAARHLEAMTSKRGRNTSSGTVMSLARS